MKLPATSLVLLPLLASPAAAQLDLTLLTKADLTLLNLGGFGGAAYDPLWDALWITDALGPISGGTNTVWQIDVLTGFPFSSFDAGSIPGLDMGADALAYDPTSGLLFLCSPFSEDEGGVVTGQGTLVHDWSSSLDSAAAAISPAGELYVITDTAAGGDGALHRVNQLLGSFETTIPITGYTGRVSEMAFDPFTGNLFAFADIGDDLLEIDPATGVVLSVTDLVTFGIANQGFPTGFAFRDDGTQLYLGKGFGADATVLYVFDRKLPQPGCGIVYCDESALNGADLGLDNCDCSVGPMNLHLSSAPPGQFGYALIAAGNGVVTNPPGAVGDLCLVGNGPIGRYTKDARVTDATGTASLDLLAAMSGGVGGGIPTIGGNLCSPTGQTWNFQWWHRDGMNPSRFSKALQATFK